MEWSIVMNVHVCLSVHIHIGIVGQLGPVELVLQLGLVVR